MLAYPASAPPRALEGPLRLPAAPSTPAGQKSHTSAATSWLPATALVAPAWLLSLVVARRKPRTAWARAPARVVSCKEDIRRAYKEFVRESHPDLNNSKVQGEEAKDKFQKLTAEYNKVMEMDDNEFWLESFDTGITRMATKRVDGPSLNPWERRFRTWARDNDLLDVDHLEDEDVDGRKRAKLYIDCEDDPSLPGCAVEEPLMKPWGPGEGPGTAGQAGAKVTHSEGIRFDQIFFGLVIAVASFIMVAFGAIVVSLIKGP